MEPQPDFGKGSGPQKRTKKEWTVKMEGSPSIKLGLGIGAATSAQKLVITQHGKRLVFTQTQLHELQQQTLIFNCIAARVPVPLHLVIPIWKSVASSFGSANGGIYKQYPSFVGFSPEGFDYRNMMDPEPGRCRRTDGKKWRCSKNVVPDQKYCERHMHRGRQRSRKLVEASQIAPPFDTTAPNNSNKYSENSKTISTPAIFQRMTPFSSNTITSHRNSTTTTTIGSGNDTIGSGNDTIGNKNSVTTFTIPAMAATTITPTPTTSTISTTPTVITANTTTSTLTTPTTSNISTSPPTTTTTTTNNNNNNRNSDSKTNHNLDGKAVNQSSKNRINMNIHVNFCPGLDFSPKSVLQVQGCSGSCFYRSDIELEPGRCRRTDGKKWRCSRDVVPEQKYCTQHMHRGAKKHVEGSQPAAVPSAARRRHTKAKANYATPNTNLSISIPASPQLMTNDEKSTNSSGSDTTITDTTIIAYEIGNFSS